MESDVSFAEKVAHLQRPEAFADAPDRVELVETHFACLFFSRRFVYKLKRPIRFHEIDFTNLETRRVTCELEVALNRRLAAAVYVGVVPLRQTEQGLALDGAAAGDPVDWLVKMHRLPRARMLDARAAGGSVSTAELGKLLEKLAAFYADAPRAPWDGRAYRARLERTLCAAGDALRGPLLGIDAVRVDAILERQLAFLAAAGATLDARCAAGRVLDAHGDLRPEHILLGDDPQIIDCLEFSAQLRLLDTAEEIAFLALECEALGDARLAAQIVGLYREICADAVPAALLRFYTSRRALVRAMLCAWHLEATRPETERRHWRARAAWYLDRAHAALEGVAAR